AQFDTLGTNAPRLRVQVLLAGLSTGQTPDLIALPAITAAGLPRVRCVSGLANSVETRPGFAIVLDRAADFTLAGDGRPLTLTGHEIRILSVDPAWLDNGTTGYLASLTALALSGPALSSFTIVGETGERSFAPSLAILPSALGFTLFWPDPNRAFGLEAATNS